MSAHTPGPWVRWDEPPFETAPGDIVIGEDNGFTVAVVFNTPRLDVEANARLIAEAPAMEGLVQSVHTLTFALLHRSDLPTEVRDSLRALGFSAQQIVARLTPLSPEHDGGK